MSLGTPGLQKWASRYWECPGWEQFAFEDFEGHTVKLFIWRVSKSKLSCWIWNLSTCRNTIPLSLSLILSGDFLLSLQLQTIWTRRTLNLTKKLCMRRKQRTRVDPKLSCWQPNHKSRWRKNNVSNLIQKSSKYLLNDPLFQQSPEPKAKHHKQSWLFEVPAK